MRRVNCVITMCDRRFIMPTETTKKTTTSPITIKLTDEERVRVQSLATHYGLTLSGVIKMLVTRDARTVGIEPAKGGVR